MTPEEVIREALARQGVRLRPGSRWRILLHAVVLNAFGREERGPQAVGRLDTVGRDQFDVTVTPKSSAGRDARELLREGLLDVIFDDGGHECHLSDPVASGLLRPGPQAAPGSRSSCWSVASLGSGRADAPEDAQGRPKAGDVFEYERETKAEGEGRGRRPPPFSNRFSSP
jgi:hypothetical protein